MFDWLVWYVRDDGYRDCTTVSADTSGRARQIVNIGLHGRSFVTDVELW